jgi:two-component system, chemotaxis family, chemotaxis protein CheY
MARILVVDDNEQMRRTLRRMLESAEHSVTEAADGRAALKLYVAESPDLVITDIIMPEREGIETIREMRRMAPDAKIVAISGSDIGVTLDLLWMARELGADAALRKPFRAAELLEVVSALLAER